MGAVRGGANQFAAQPPGLQTNNTLAPRVNNGAFSQSSNMFASGGPGQGGNAVAAGSQLPASPRNNGLLAAPV